MEPQNTHHTSTDHDSQESFSEHFEENTLAIPASAAILKRLRLGRPSLLPEMDEAQVLATLESFQWQLRVAAVQKLEEYGELAPIEHLIRALKDEHEAVRAAAAHALGTLGNPKAVTPLVEVQQDPIWLVRTAVVQALGKLGEQVHLEPFMLALHDEDESVRAAAVRALGTMGERVPTERFMETLQDSAWQVREMALLALGSRGGYIPQAALILALQDEDESVRSAAHLLQKNYPDRLVANSTNLPANISLEITGATLDAQERTLQPVASIADHQERKQEEPSNELRHLDDERDLLQAAQHYNRQRYPRKRALRLLRLALLACWSIFLGYLLSSIWNLVQLTHANMARLTTRVTVQILSAPLTALADLNVPVWVRGVCALLALLLFFGCLWAARDTWYEHKWAQGQGVHREELAPGSRDQNQFTRAPVNPPQQIPATRLFSRRTVMVGLTTVLIVGNSIAWSLLINSKRKQGSSSLALGSLLYINRRHTGNVRSVAWSPDSTRIASASDDKTVQVWDVATGGHSFIYSGHTSPVLTVAWSPDGRLVASAGVDGTVQVWDASTGLHVFTYHGHTGDEVTAVAWSPDGKRIASVSSGQGKVQVWDAATGGHRNTYFDIPAAAELTVAWSPDGRRIAAAGEDGNALVWDVSTGQNIFTNTFGYAHGFQKSDAVKVVAWSPDSTRIASGSDGKTVQVWDATNGKHVYTYRGHYNAPLGFITSVAWSPEGTRIASGSDDRTVQVWDAINGEHVHIYRGHTDMVTSVAWSPDGRLIASGSDDKTVQVWGAG